MSRYACNKYFSVQQGDAAISAMSTKFWRRRRISLGQVHGDVVVIPGNVKHALRNRSSLPVTLALVTKSELYAFFRELANPFDPNLRLTPPTAEEIQELFAIAAKYGYWLGLEETAKRVVSAAIQCRLLPPRKIAKSF
jgi:hypothetical protein